MSYFTQFGYKDSANLDAFARLRVSNPQTIFDSKQIADKLPLLWDDQLISGSGGASTYNANQASTTLSVANTTAALRARQTFRRFNYQPGKSQLIIQSGIFGTAAIGIRRKAGLFDSRNGVFFDQFNTGMGVTIRTFTSGSAVDTRVAQASWNIDKMDGTGVSGVTLDYTKVLIWIIDFEWAGRVRFGWFVDGKLYYCHQVLSANSSTLIHMSTPTLPLRVEIENTGTGGAVGFTQIDGTIISEGAGNGTLTGFPCGIARAAALTTNNDTSIYPLVALRLSSSYLTSTIRLGKFSIVCTSTATYNYFLILNPTVAGTALVWSAFTNGSTETQISTTSATTVTGGTVLTSGVSTQTNEGQVNDFLEADFSLGSTIAGVSDIVVLAIQRVTGTSETFYGSLNWKDQK